MMLPGADACEANAPVAVDRREMTVMKHGLLRRCSCCGEVRSFRDFGVRNEDRGYAQSWCRTCHGQKAARHAAEQGVGPASLQNKIMRNRRWRMRKVYGITPEDYERMYDEQGGLCAICGVEGERAWDRFRDRLVVDHCHSTGVVRGLLCDPCNRGIGAMRDDADVLRRAIAYLERSGS